MEKEEVKQALLKVMGYSKIPPECKDCKHSGIGDNDKQRFCFYNDPIEIDVFDNDWCYKFDDHHHNGGFG